MKLPPEAPTDEPTVQFLLSNDLHVIGLSVGLVLIALALLLGVQLWEYLDLYNEWQSRKRRKRNFWKDNNDDDAR